MKQYIFFGWSFEKFFLKDICQKALSAFLLILLPFGWCSAETGKKEQAPTRISGFLDATFNFNKTSGLSTFTLTQAEVDIIKILSGRAGVRLDLNLIQKSDTVDTESGMEGGLSSNELLEQGYISLKDGNSTVSVGKFNVPIGFEFPDPPQMFQKSHSMIFDFGLPTSATGLWVMTDLGTMNFSFYIVNGWDTIVDDNNQKTYGGRVGFMPSESFKMGVSYITGNETGNGAWEEAENLSVFDVDVTVFSESGSIIGFEYTRGVHEKNGLIKPGEDDARWNGLLFMTYLKLSDVSGITFRYDVFRDDDGARLPSGVKEKRQAYTISPSLVFGDGPSLRLEYRDVTSTESVFKGKKNMLEKREKVFGVEVFYNF